MNIVIANDYLLPILPERPRAHQLARRLTMAQLYLINFWHLHLTNAICV